MNAGQRTIEWLYEEALGVDDEWAVRTRDGFRWWADQQAQTVEVVGQETGGPEGETAYLVGVRTEVVRGLDLNGKSLGFVNHLLGAFASMAGPVYDARTQSLGLCSLVAVHDEISGWMNPLIGMAAALQVGEARIMGPELASMLGCEVATSAHPESGPRPVPDEMAEVIAELVAPCGQGPSQWAQEEFSAVAGQCSNLPSVIAASARGAAMTAEFVCGDASSSCQLLADAAPHPRYGNGLLVLQHIPASAVSEDDGYLLALRRNERELTRELLGYGFGSYCYRDGSLYFVSFYPNVLYRPGLLVNILLACGMRALRLGGPVSG